MRTTPLKGTPVIKRNTVWVDNLSWMELDTPEWFTWLLTVDRFYYQGEAGTFSARREKRQRGGNYWFGYRRVDGKLHNVYLGRTVQLTATRLQEAVVKLNAKGTPTPVAEKSNRQKGATSQAGAVPAPRPLQPGDLALVKAGYEVYWQQKFGKAPHFEDGELVVVRESHVLPDSGNVSVFIRNVDDPHVVGAAPEEFLTAVVEEIQALLASGLDEKELSPEAAQAIRPLTEDAQADLAKAAGYMLALGGAAYHNQMVVERDTTGVVFAFPNANRLSHLVKKGVLAYVIEPDGTKRYRLSSLGIQALRVLQPGNIKPLIPKPAPPVSKRQTRRAGSKAAASPRKAGQSPLPGYQFKVALLDLRPEVWRRFRVPGDIDFYDLHQVLQFCMGWESYHLYQFFVHDHCIGDSMGGNADRYVDERIARYVDLEQPHWGYQYDFGDLWEHEIVLERILKESIKFPVCVAGKRACPPEDCGGPGIYGDYLEARRRKRIPRWLRERVGSDHDPAEFDLKAVNQALKEYWADRARELKEAKKKV